MEPPKTLEEQKFQSTPPRGRRLQQLLFIRVILEISIHASAREATQQDGFTEAATAISIHASAREATALITNFYI